MYLFVVAWPNDSTFNWVARGGYSPRNEVELGYAYATGQNITVFPNPKIVGSLQFVSLWFSDLQTIAYEVAILIDVRYTITSAKMLGVPNVSGNCVYGMNLIECNGPLGTIPIEYAFASARNM